MISVVTTTVLVRVMKTVVLAVEIIAVGVALNQEEININIIVVQGVPGFANDLP